MESHFQLASVLLRQYVDCHWSHNAGEKFKPPETSDQVHAVLRYTIEAPYRQCKENASYNEYLLEKIHKVEGNVS